MEIAYEVKINGTFKIPSDIVEFQDRINKVFDYPLTSKKYAKFRDEVDAKIINMAGISHEMVYWQISKKKEILEKTIKNKKINIEGDNVSFDVAFDIYFPENWGIEFVLDWAYRNGFDEVYRIYTFIHSELRSEGISDDEQHKMFEFLMNVTQEMNVNAVRK